MSEQESRVVDSQYGEPLATASADEAPMPTPAEPTISDAALMALALEACRFAGMAGAQAGGLVELFKVVQRGKELTSRELHKGTGDVLRDIAHAQRFTEGIQDGFGGRLGKEIDFVDRALRVAANEIKQLRLRLASREKSQ